MNRRRWDLRDRTSKVYQRARHLAEPYERKLNVLKQFVSLYDYYLPKRPYIDTCTEAEVGAYERAGEIAFNRTLKALTPDDYNDLTDLGVIDGDTDE